MKPGFALLCLSVSLLAAMQARAISLPAACGDDKVRFNVTTQRNQPMPTAPEAGKAQIVFMEDENQMIGPFMHATVRFGMDGTWVGANNGSSYFVLTVDPGVHHLCAGWQSSIGRVRKNVHAASLKAEPDEGKFRVKSLKLATWTTNK
jgi:hypothetical protein